MKLYLAICCAAIIPFTCFAQGSSPPAALDELQYLRFMLMSIASIDHDSRAAKVYEDGLVKQFGLNSQDLAAIRAAGQELNQLLKQLSQGARDSVPARAIPTQAQAAALSALALQREQRLETLANRILNQIRPETAFRLRTFGRVGTAKGRK